MWFPDSSMEYPFGGGEAIKAAATMPDQENLEDLLMMADSMDADDSLKPGICAETSFCDSQDDQQEQEKVPLTPPVRRYSQRPKTPPTVTLSFKELPPIISPDLGLNFESDTSSLVEETFQPPKRPIIKVSRKRKVPPPTSSRLDHPGVAASYRVHPTSSHEQSLLNKLIQSMSRSHASRREILRRRHMFGNHPALYEFERLDDSQRRIWTFMASQHVHST